MPGKRKVTVDELPVEIKDDTIYVINQPNPNSVTHNYFKYPCKFIPEIPRWAMKAYLNCENGLVLDPFAGSGTTLRAANELGRSAFGFEIDRVFYKRAVEEMLVYKHVDQMNLEDFPEVMP